MCFTTSCQKRDRFLVGLANVPIMSTEFAIFVPCTKHFNILPIYGTVAKHIVSMINNLKMMARGHTVHLQQAILLIVMAFPIYFIWRMNRN